MLIDSKNRWQWFCGYDETDKKQIRTAQNGLFEDLSDVIKEVQKRKRIHPDHFYSIVVFEPSTNSLHRADEGANI